MRITVEIDEKPLGEAMAVSGLPTKRAAIEEALRLLIRETRQSDMQRLRGVGWQGDLGAMRRDH